MRKEKTGNRIRLLGLSMGISQILKGIKVKLKLEGGGAKKVEI